MEFLLLAGAVGAAVPVLPGSPFTLKWAHEIESPYTPLSLGVVTEKNTVVVGSRNCPDNTENMLEFIGLESGTVVRTVKTNGTSDVAIAHRAKEMVVAGVGWLKDEGSAGDQTVLAESEGSTANTTTGWEWTFNGDPAMWNPAAVSADGKVSALLLEKNPSMKNLNNRSGTLFLFTANSPTPAFKYELDGLGPTDPQSVAISAKGHGKGGTTYTVGALIGVHTVIIDFDASTGDGAVVYNKKQSGDDDEYPDLSIAITADGELFAITSGGSVDIYRRAQTAAGGFKKLHEVLPPKDKLNPGQSPVRTVFSESSEVGGAAGTSVLATAWTDEAGDTTGVSAHLISSAAAKSLWGSVQTCKNDYNDVSNNGVAVSAGGEYLAFGMFGCGAKPNFLVFKGVGGVGIPVLEVSNKGGEVWAVDVDVDAAGKTIVAAGIWPPTPKGKSTVLVYST